MINADEFGLCYSPAPTQAIGPGLLPEKKKSKESFTLLVGSNVDGTDRVPPLMISRSARYRCFVREKPTEAALEYKCNYKDWMNSAVNSG